MDNDDYTAKMTELIRLMRAIGNDTQQCEVKECAHKISTTITDTLSAFSNGNGGYIILGLSEKNGFTPVDGFNARSMQEALSQACEKLTPVVRPVIVTRPFEGANLVFAVIDEMLPREKPCYFTAAGPYNGSYIRTGDGDRRMTAYEVDRLLEEQRQPEHDIAVVEGATATDLSPALVQALLVNERARHGHVFEGMSDEEMLLNLRAVGRLCSDTASGSETGDTVIRPTLAGLLALGRYPQKFYPRLTISAAMFPGISRDEVFSTGRELVRTAVFVGPIPTMVCDAVETLMDWSRSASPAFDPARPPYPQAVLREAISNALIHRDYSPDAVGTPVHVDMFADRIEITNPGGLFGAVTKRTLKQPASGSTRNPFLFSLLRSVPYPSDGMVLQDNGTGYRRIEALLRNEQRPPARIDNSIGSFRVTIPARSSNSPGSSGMPGSSRLSA